MQQNHKKIGSRYSVFLLVTLGVIQTTFCAQDDDDSFLIRVPTSRKTYNKENFTRKRAYTVTSPTHVQIPVAGSGALVSLQEASPERYQELGYDNQEVMNIAETAFSDDRKRTVKKSRKRQSLSYDESPTDPVEDATDSSQGSARGSSDHEALILLGLNPLQIMEALICDASLYIEDLTADTDEPGSPRRKRLLEAQDIDLGKFTPQKIEQYRELGGQSPQLRKSISLLKKLHGSPIRDKKSFPRSTVTLNSPSARMVMSRLQLNYARDTGLVTPLPPIAHKEPVAPETPEQRLERKQRQRAEFEAAEKELGRLPQQLNDELTIALQPWKYHFSYIGLKKPNILAGLEIKMRWPDLVGAFLKYVAPHYTRMEIDGYDVYFSLQTLDFKRQGRSGLNHEDMSDGLCPRGADGLLMNYHHVTKLDPHSHKVKIDENAKLAHETPYIIVLIPGSIHTEYSYYLHCEEDTYVLPRNELNRTLFGHSREKFNQTIVATYYKG